MTRRRHTPPPSRPEKMIELLCLVDEGEDLPWAYLAWGRHAERDFRAVVRHFHEHGGGDPAAEFELEAGWGRWRKSSGSLVADEFFGDGWPIPFLNRRYMLAVLK